MVLRGGHLKDRRLVNIMNRMCARIYGDVSVMHIRKRGSRNFLARMSRCISNSTGRCLR